MTDAITHTVPASNLDPGRVGDEVTDLRRHTARGTIVNSAYQVGIAALAALERLVAAAFLTRSEFGLWIVILMALVTLGWLKDLGIMDKFVQQSELDQELAFQKAFTFELLLSCAFFVVVLVALPLYALAYGHWEIVVPAIVLATSVPISAFETPAWVPYRRLDYVRQRVLMSVDPAVTFVVTVALAIAGAGYWCFVIGVVAGSAAGAIVCTLSSPFPLRLRFDRRTAREYASFSWPLFGSGLSRLLVVQGAFLVANRTVGLAGIGAIGLAAQIAMLTDRVDAVVSQTIYPAVCAVVDRTEALFEAFVKSNRLALMWGFPFGVGVALFAHDLVDFVIGDAWLPAVGVIAGIAVACAFGQVAFNWTVFMRATNNTRPLFVAAVLDVVVFLAVVVPGLILWGLPGYVAGFAATTAVQIAVRGWYTSRLFRGFSVVRQLVRSVLPALPPAALVLLVRAVDGGGSRTPGRAVAELALFVVATVICTWVAERQLLREVFGYLRGRSANPLEPAAT